VVKVLKVTRVHKDLKVRRVHEGLKVITVRADLTVQQGPPEPQGQKVTSVPQDLSARSA
jgi:hypothetical protein